MQEVNKIVWISICVLITVSVISIAYFVVARSDESRRGVTKDVQSTYSAMTTSGLDTYVGQSVTGQTVKNVIKEYFDPNNRSAVKFTISKLDSSKESGYYKFNIFYDLDIEKLNDNTDVRYVDASTKFTVLAIKNSADLTVGLQFVEEY